MSIVRPVSVDQIVTDVLFVVPVCSLWCASQSVILALCNSQYRLFTMERLIRSQYSNRRGLLLLMQVLYELVVLRAPFSEFKPQEIVKALMTAAHPTHDLLPKVQLAYPTNSPH